MRKDVSEIIRVSYESCLQMRIKAFMCFIRYCINYYHTRVRRRKTRIKNKYVFIVNEIELAKNTDYET